MTDLWTFYHQEEGITFLVWMLKDQGWLLSAGTPTISLLQQASSSATQNIRDHETRTSTPWTQKAKQPRTGRIPCTSRSSTVLRKELICGEPSMHRELVDICSPFEVACERMNLWSIFWEKIEKDTSTSGLHRICGVWNSETQLLFLLLNRFFKWDSFIFWIPTSNSAIPDGGAQPRVADGLWFAISKEDPVAEASGCELALGTVKKKTDVPNLCNKALKWKNMQQDDKMPLKRCLFILP